MKIIGQIFGRRFCTYCGKNAVHYYKWHENGEKIILGECFCCGEIHYCDNDTEENIKNRFKDMNWIDMNEPIIIE